MSAELPPLRILFVDDEPKVLDGLRRAMHRERDRWRSRFVATGAEALAELERESADVVISDMRMPVMDGATLLEQVAQLRPHAVRVVLSGQADEESALRSARVAHRFLAKPLPTPLLRSTIEQFENARRRLPDQARRAMAGSELLPITQSAYENVVGALRASVAAVDAVARCVETDAALTAAVLHLAHSSFFGQAVGGTSLEDALRTIGLGTFRTFMGSEEMRRAASPRLQPRVDQEHRRSLTAARIAARIAPPGLANDASLAALLGGLGTLLLASCDEPHDDAEADAITAYLLGIWGVPAVLRPAGAHEVRGTMSARCLAVNARAMATGRYDDRISRECRAIAEEERSADEASAA